MNSLFYQGFVPTSMSRRASALVGTQTEIPAVFARRLLARFQAGARDNIAGRILLDLRREGARSQGRPRLAAVERRG